jgi:hypothetical protein
MVLTQPLAASSDTSNAVEATPDRRDSNTSQSSTNLTDISSIPSRPPTRSRLDGPANFHLKRIPRPLGSTENFQNALLVHQKRLKANSAEIFRSATAVQQLIDNYHNMIALHLKSGGIMSGPSGADLRKMARTAIGHAIEKYDGLLEARRRVLEEHGALLELASEITYLRAATRLLDAIDLQIVAAEDLGQRMAARASNSRWNVFKQASAI